MADDVSVKFGADIASLSASMKAAQASVEGFAARVKASIAGLQAPFEQLNKAILGVAAVAAGGLIFKSFVDEAVTAATETNKLAKTFGISVDAASTLRVQLKATGNTVEEYVGAALKLDRQVRQNEETIRKTGMATRDANGALLSQQQLMVNAIATLRTYKEGTDRNIASQVLFGRGVSEIEGLMRLNSASMQRASRDAKELQLAVTPQDIANARAYKVAIGELELTFQAIKKAIGEAVLPYLTAFSNWFRAQGPTIISNMKETAKTVIEFAFDAAKGFVEFAMTVANTLAGIFTLIQYLRAKTGSITIAEGEASIDRVNAALEKLNNLKDKALAGIDALKSTVLTGGPQAPVVPGDDGARTAENLTKASKVAGQIAKIQLDAQLKVDKIKFEEEQNAIEASFNQHRISEDQKYALLLQAKDKEYRLEIATLEKEQAALAGDVVKREQVLAKIKVAREQHELDIQRINNQSVAAQQAKYEQLFSTIQGAWDSQMRGLLAGTTTWATAFKNILADLIIQFISFAEKMALNWAAAEIAKTTATTTGVAARTAAESAGQGASLLLAIGNAIKAIFASVGQTIAGVTAFLAPEQGPAAVPEGIAAGAATLAAGLALVPSFQTGAWSIPADTAALLHAGEMVLPKGPAGDMRNALTGGGAGGDTHINVSFEHHGNLTRQQVKEHARTLAEEIKNLMPLNPTLRPKWG